MYPVLTVQQRRETRLHAEIFTRTAPPAVHARHRTNPGPFRTTAIKPSLILLSRQLPPRVYSLRSSFWLKMNRYL